MLKMCFDINTKVFLNIKKAFLLSLHQNNFRSIIVFIITISKRFRLNIVVSVLFRFTHRYNIIMLKCKSITTYDTCILSLQHSNIPMKICLFYVLPWCITMKTTLIYVLWFILLYYTCMLYKRGNTIKK